MSYLKQNIKEDCSGCQACKQICPRNAIDMIEDEEGFLYPKKNSNCIECGLCEKICPLQNKILNKTIEQKVYAGEYKDKDILRKSSSGGAFTAICNSFCDENYVIFGAKFDNNFHVKHDYIEDINEIDIFRKSKYVQSDINKMYLKVKEFLNQGKKVVFSGTPCQIAGLKSFLNNKEFENLLCVDIICHGVPSAKVWNQYIKYVEKKYNSRIKEINFREKIIEDKKYNSRNLKIKLENGKIITENSNKSYYLKGFHNKLFYRPSCEKCKFANSNRISDITIGDCWGINKIHPELDVHKGVSLIVINTEKGNKIKEKLEEYMNLQKLDLNFAIKENAQFREPTKFHKNRDKFYKSIDNNLKFNKKIKKYAKESYKVIIKRNITKFIPKKIKKIIKDKIKKQ